MAFDVVIIGAGHNGLVTAAYLAKAGRRVLVLERRELVGGCAVTEEIWPGFRVSTAAYLTSLLQDRIVKDLDLERFGYHVDAKDPAFFSPFPDGRYLFMWQDRQKTLAEIAKFSRRDAERYPAYEEHLERLSVFVESMLLTTPPDFPPKRAGDFLEFLKIGARMAKLGPKEMVGLVKIFTQSAADFLDEWFESPEVKVTLATDGVIGANGGPRSPGTAYILLHHCMGGVGGKRGLWGFVRGGMGAVTQAMADSARSSGATIRVNAVRGARPGAGRPRPRRGAGGRRRNPRERGGFESRPGRHLPAPRRGIGSRTRFSVRHARLPYRRHVAQNESGAERTARFSRAARSARARSIAPRCTSARPWTMWSTPGTTPNTAAPPSVRSSR